MKIIDFHCDTASLIYHNQKELLSNDYHIDLKRMKKANYAGQWFAFFIYLEGLNGKSPYDAFNSMYHYFIEQVNKNTDLIEIVTSYDEYKACQEKEKLAAFLSLEEGQVIEQSLDKLDDLVKKGIRLMSFTWNTPNDLGYPHSINKGLTPFGKEVADYLNSVPMLLDISHLSEDALGDIVQLYKKPIIASHSNARGFYPATRNVTDSAIKIIAQSGGVIGTNFYSYFLSDTNYTSVDTIVKSIEYLYQKGGEDVLALGTDFDGIDCGLEVCTCLEMDKLITELMKKLPSYVVEKFCHKNAERILKENL